MVLETAETLPLPLHLLLQPLSSTPALLCCSAAVMGWLTEKLKLSQMAVLCCNGFWSTCSSLLRRTVQQQQQQHSPAELKSTVWIQSECGKKKWTRGAERKIWSWRMWTKDKALCASVTGRDNIPKLEKVWGRTDRDTCVVKLQRQALEWLGKTCLTGTTGLQTLGVLWLEERPRWCWGGQTAGRGVQTLWITWTIGSMSTEKTVSVFYCTLKVKINSLGRFSTGNKRYLCNNFTKSLK